MTLTRRLLLLALISVLPAIVIWTFTEVSLRRAREAEVHELAIRQAHLAGAELERIFDGVHSLLLAVDETPSIRAFDTPHCSPYLKAIQQKVPYLLSFVAIDLSGFVRCRPSGTIDTKHHYSDSFYFMTALEKRGFVIGEFTRQFDEGELPPHPVLPMALPIWDNNGDIVGVLAAVLDLQWLDQKLKERALPADGSVTITDRKGVVLAREPFPERFVGRTLPLERQEYLVADKPGSFEALSMDGTERIIGYIPLKLAPQGIYVSVGLSTKAAFESINNASRRGFLLIAVAFVLALSLAWLVSRTFITKPFDLMTDAVRAWRKGNYRARIRLPGDQGEFGILAKAFNDLMDDLAERQNALQVSEERARLALESGHMGSWWYDHANKKAGLSSKAAQLLNLPPTQDTITIDEWQALVHPDDAESVIDKLRAAVAGSGEYEDEFRIRHRDGTVCWINSRGRVFYDNYRRPISFVGVLQDITARRQTEDQQRLLLDELNHRVKNTLATVQSIAGQTLRSTETPGQFKEAFEGRLLALSKTHDLLTRKSWREADLHDIAEQELAPYRKNTDHLVVIEGPTVNLPARYAINLGLVLHELVTNAAKYGALSTPAGHLTLEWDVANKPGGPPQLRIHWEESDGPPVAPPARQGFGSRLIRRSVEGELAGELAVDFAPTGVCYEIVAPLPEIESLS